MAKQESDNDTLDLLYCSDDLLKLKPGTLPEHYFDTLVTLSKIESSVQLALKLHLVDGLSQLQSANSVSGVEQPHISRALSKLKKISSSIAILAQYLQK